MNVTKTNYKTQKHPLTTITNQARIAHHCSLSSWSEVRFSLNQVNQNQFDPSDVCLSSLHVQLSHFVMSLERLPPLPSSVQFSRMEPGETEVDTMRIVHSQT